LIKGPVEINPLNIATIRPVPRIKVLSILEKAIINGVNNIPPPIPAKTDITAIRKLKEKNVIRIIKILISL
ncbi:MAG TPA: hypothetical protein P5270_09105, partial [Victivallales bacterium]|nr:hypothetical protein [Victivallales bacterium]